MSALKDAPAGLERPGRIPLIDILRGLVIIIMALDHTREFTHASGYAYNVLSPTKSTPLLYMTRWVTHLCAPTFVFLAGAGIRLQALGGRTGWSLARRIITRGLWLVLLELTVIGFFWSFSIPFLQFLQVIWAIGWSMVLLAAFVWAPAWVSLVTGAVIIIASSALLAIPYEALGGWAPLWAIGVRGGVFAPSYETAMAFIAYPILPWFGVMALGYGMGGVFLSHRRSLWLAGIGLAMLVLFLVLRLPNLYGDAHPWQPQGAAFWTVRAILDVNKNPPTLDFVLVTLGLVFVVAPLLERLPKPLAGLLRTYGAVPFIAYIAHLVVMHSYAIIARLIAGGPLEPMTNTMAAFLLDQGRFGSFSLPIGWVYVVWIAVVATLYPLCRWWGALKQRRRDWWLSYL